MIIQFHWPLIGSERQQRLLQRHLTRNTIAHAYLIHGPEGVGKADIALLFAQSILCGQARRPCRECESCLQFQKGIHPDALFVRRIPQAKAISVDQIRALNRFATLRPVRSQSKVAIVFDAEDMNALAANAFLKTLEEPPAYMTIVLVAHRIDTIPGTVLSRCQMIAMRPMSNDAVREFLTDEPMSDAEKDMIVAFARGRIGVVREMMHDQSQLFKKKLEDAFRFLESKASDQVFLLHEWIKGLKGSDAGLGSFAIARETFERLNYLEVIARDILLQHFQQPKLVATPHAARLRLLAQRYPVRQLSAMLRGVAALRHSLSQNANVQLSWEHFLLQAVI